MIVYLAPVLLWVILGLLVTNRQRSGRYPALARASFVALGPVIGSASAVRAVADAADPELLSPWLAGMGIGGMLILLVSYLQIVRLSRLPPERRLYLRVGMMWLWSLAMGMIFFVFTAAVLILVRSL